MGLSHEVYGMPAAAANVGHVDALRHAFGQALDEGKDVVEEGGVVDGGAVLRHDAVEFAVLRIRHAPAPAEALDQRRLHPGHQRDELGQARQVVRSGGMSQAGVFRRQLVRGGPRVVRHHPASGHGAQPLPDVALLQSGGVSDLGARRWRQLSQRVEQPDVVAHTQQERQRRVVDGRNDPAGEAPPARNRSRSLWG